MTDADRRWQTERAAMVEQQLRRRGVSDDRLLQAMGRVRRELFVPAPSRSAAYGDHALPIALGQTISQPFMVARSCELAQVGSQDRVLEVGAGSGYQAAVLGELAREVFSLEILPGLVEGARQALQANGSRNVHIVLTDGSLGYREQAPYDAILVACGAPHVPAALLDQLAPAGRLVIPVGPAQMQLLTLLEHTPQGVSRREFEPCVYVPLTGADGRP